MATEEEQEDRRREKDQDIAIERQTLDTILRNQATQWSNIYRNMVENQPQLVDKLIGPKLMPSSPYHGIIPSINFGNFSDDPTGVISSLYANMVFNLTDCSNQGKLEPRLALKWSAKWTTNIEESKARGPERISKLFFGAEQKLTLKRETPEFKK